MIVIAVALFALWPLAAESATPQAVLYFDAWWAWNAREFYGPNLTEPACGFSRNVGWYTWPLWPFALWTLVFVAKLLAPSARAAAHC